eukprot:4462000-Prymnesium_polylepis.1
MCACCFVLREASSGGGAGGPAHSPEPIGHRMTLQSPGAYGFMAIWYIILFEFDIPLSGSVTAVGTGHVQL